MSRQKLLILAWVELQAHRQRRYVTTKGRKNILDRGATF